MGSQNAELLRMRVSVRAKCYCEVPLWWAQYEVYILLFVLPSLVPTYYNGLAQQDSADDQTHVWTITLTEYVSMTGDITCLCCDELG